MFHLIRYITQIENCEVTLTRVVKSRPLNSTNRDTKYPEEFMPFYLFGTSTQAHISHMLLRAPNVSLSASNVNLDLDNAQEVANELHNGLILTLSDYREVTMQPFPAKNKEIRDQGETFFFRKDKTFNVQVFQDPKKPVDEGPGLLNSLGKPMTQGKMTLGDDVHVDVEAPNYDPFDQKPPTKSWKDELNRIKKVLNGKQEVCEA